MSSGTDVWNSSRTGAEIPGGPGPGSLGHTGPQTSSLSHTGPQTTSTTPGRAAQARQAGEGSLAGGATEASRADWAGGSPAIGSGTGRGTAPATAPGPATAGHLTTGPRTAAPGGTGPSTGLSGTGPSTGLSGTGPSTGLSGTGPSTTSPGPMGLSTSGRANPGRSGTGLSGTGLSGGGGSPAAGGSLWSAGAFRTAGPDGRGPVRGYPPAPGAPDPVYPPGQFSPWNSAALRDARAAGRSAPGADATGDAAEPGYPLLAVSDPAADATATQTWSVLDEADMAGEWTSKRADGGTGPAPAGAGLAGSADGGPFGPADGYPDGPEGLAGLAGYAAAAGLAPGQPGLAGTEPGQPRPGGRLAARRDRQAAQAQAQDGTGPQAAWPGDGTTGSWTAPGETGGPWGGQQEGPGYWAAQAPSGTLAAPQHGTGEEFGAAPGGPDWGDRNGWGTGSREAVPDGTGPGGTGSRSAAHGRKPGKPRKARKPASRARMWLMPLVMMVVVAVLIGVAYLHFVKGRATASGGTPSRKPSAAGSPSPNLGPWKHITTRTQDPAPLTLTEMFPARYSAGGTTVIRTVQRADTTCPPIVLGAKLQAALRKAGCTQVMRASYLSAGQKIMATIGVLNLADVNGAQQAGQATGATAFIKQLPGAKGPTRNLSQGTGLEEAQIKGHYLILTWAEFTNLKAPGNAKQRAQLDAFSRNLVGATANISLTSRMLFGKPETP